MLAETAQSIADRVRRLVGPRVFGLVLAASTLVGALAAWRLARLGLTLSHYDARAHLVVARRVIDSLTPGWRQFGAVWLPLPHLLNLLPVQWDWAYRTGAAAIAWSVASISVGLAAFAQRVFARTGSLVAALAGPVLILGNPNVLYLASTPMTEPLLIGLSLTSLAAIDAWLEHPDDTRLRRSAWWLAALVLTRYEGWLVAAGLVGVAGLATRRRGVRPLVRLITPAAVVLAGFVCLSYGSTGRWFVSNDFFVPDGEARHAPVKAAGLVVTGLVQLAGLPLALAGALGAATCLVRARRSPAALLPLALALSAVLPLGAFDAGHPFRIRYMVPLVAACGALAAIALGLASRRVRVAAAAAIIALSVRAHAPLSLTDPMVREAQWETPFRLARQGVTAALRRDYDGTPILASMGSLAHYMHETSAMGLTLAHFLHEGNGDLWLEALRSPRRSVRWILIEERAEGGDMLAARARTDPSFLEGFRRVAEGGGLALYRRDP